MSASAMAGRAMADRHQRNAKQRPGGARVPFSAVSAPALQRSIYAHQSSAAGGEHRSTADSQRQSES
ncbi:hypothetical protein CUR178_08160 [Leishmania enriettii]|uniref:Uncharacterized protein n=1 Tax=Leishmania enriettii TaxID=5663 RepID=A0A836L3B4_LEIEN|nr:hypothetical protein CUR178_08160 [Leishmania enriettii]